SSSVGISATALGDRRYGLGVLVSTGPHTLSIVRDDTPGPWTVTSFADSGPGSLRQAVLEANGHPGADVINFAPAVRGTIGLTTGQLNITDDLTIDGPGADELTVSGNHASRVFSISGGATVTFTGLTISDGRAVGSPGSGGGIENNGSTLTLAHVVLSNNEA